MQRRILLAAAAILAVLALVLWARRETSPERAVDPTRSAAVPDRENVAPLARPPTAASERAEVAAPPPDELAADTRAKWTGARVRVTAVEDGSPLVGVRLSAFTPGPRRETTAVDRSHGALDEEPRTGADGVAEIELTAGVPYQLNADPPTDSVGSGYLKVDPPLAEHEVRELAITLPTRPDIVLHGRVIDRETNAPIPNARVGRSEGPGKGWNEIASEGEQRTDADGRFRVVGSSWQRKVVNVLAAGYEVACVALVQGHATAETALEIPVSPVATLRITVLDAAGAPISGVRASLTTALYHFGRPNGMALLNGSGWSSDAVFAVSTNNDGVGVLEDLPPRIPLEGVLHRGREELLRISEPLTLSPGESRAITWRVGAGCTIHGTALETDGRPAAGLSICLEAARMRNATYFPAATSEPRRFALTDDVGAFSFADVAPGNWLVGPAPKKIERKKTVTPEEPAPYAQLVAVAAGVARVDVELRVHRGLTIRGRVLEPTGAPAKYALVDYTQAAGKVSAGENVNHPEGQFVLGPLHPGEYELRASSHGDFVNSEKLIAHAGDTDVELRLRAGGKIRGVVVDKATGTPTAAEVVIRPHAPVDWSVSMPSTNDKGVFELSGLAPGLYDVAATTSNGQVGLIRALEIAVGAAGDLRIEVEPGARVRMRYEGPWPHCGVSVLLGDVLTSTDGIEKGTERTFVSFAGSVVIRVRSYAEQKDYDLPLTLTVGETRDVVFDGTWK